jgi:hypothetical protein
MACAEAELPSDYIIFKASLNGSREKAKEFSSVMMKKNVLFNEHVTPLHIRQALPSVLDKRASMALMTMSRIEEENRLKNENFVTCLKRKLRLRIINNVENYVCKCGQQLDCYADHCLMHCKHQNQGEQWHTQWHNQSLPTNPSNRQTH